MKHTAETLPLVSPMMVRRFTPIHSVDVFGGVIVFDEYEVEDVSPVEMRNAWDAEVVDCSNRICDITNAIIFQRLKEAKSWSVFPSRRWRNFRDGEDFSGVPSRQTPLLYLGNPVRIFWSPTEGITVIRLSEFLIKSGAQLEMERDL